MRYILDDNGYIYSVSCNPIECDSKGCTEYTGATPEGYDSIELWATTANIRAYKIVDGNLVYDEARAAALEAEWSSITGNKTLLFEGVAGAGDTINLTDDYTKFKVLHIVTGLENLDFGSALIASTLSINDEIDGSKIWCNSNGQTQIHAVQLNVINTKQLKVNSAYWQRLAQNNTAGLSILNTVYVRRIYGTL